MAVSQELLDHLASGATHMCRCWSLVRTDGVTFGFTDHDRPLVFDGQEFVADSGLTARALEQTTGLSVDNSEALGILSHASITEADIQAGRYDGAVVQAWLVNWSNVAQRLVLFKGEIGEIQRKQGAFTAELRGMTEALNQRQGRVFQSTCSAVLGDADCQFDLTDSAYSVSLPVETLRDDKFFEFADLTNFADRWFERGTFRVETGAAKGLVGIIKNDRLTNGARTVELWEQLRAPVVVGDTVRLEAGCDKRSRTCRVKFDNLVNFRGFPTLPGEDWLMSVPKRSGTNTGGSQSG